MDDTGSILPGTVVETEWTNGAEEFIGTLFVANGLVLSQVLQLTGLSAHTVQNWVKRGFVAPPVNKKYDKEQFCSIVLINMLQPVVLIEHICRLIAHVGGLRKDAASAIYFAFLRTLAVLPEDALGANTDLEAIISDVLKKMQMEDELFRRLLKVLHAMVLAHLSTRLKADADERIAAILK